MPLDVLHTRMPEWLGKVPYNHNINRSWGYPTDCSGFVSWALNMTYHGHPLTVKAYEWGSYKYTSRVAYDDMQFGDVGEQPPLLREKAERIEDSPLDSTT